MKTGLQAMKSQLRKQRIEHENQSHDEGSTEVAAALTVFETFIGARRSAGRKNRRRRIKFLMSERQRVHGTAVVSRFGETREKLVSNIVVPPFRQKFPGLKSPFASFVCFAVRSQCPRYCATAKVRNSKGAARNWPQPVPSSSFFSSAY